MDIIQIISIEAVYKGSETVEILVFIIFAVAAVLFLRNSNISDINTDNFDAKADKENTILFWIISSIVLVLISIFAVSVLYYVGQIFFQVTFSIFQFLGTSLTFLISLPVIFLDRAASFFRLFGIKDPATAWYLLGFVLATIIRIAQKTF